MIRTNHSKSLPTLSALSLALVAALASQGAFASAFQLAENSATGRGRADAGGPAAPGDCALVVNNPAAMSDFSSQCVQTTLSMINFSAKFRGGGNDFLGTPTTGGNGGDAGDTLPVPAAFYIHPVNEQLALGLGLSVPYGFKTEYDDRWVGRYQSVKTNLQAPALTFAASWKFSNELSLGASLVAQRLHADLVQDIDIGTILAVPTNGAVLPQEADGQGRLTGSDWGYGFGLGALWKPTANDRFGINFRSQIDHTISKGNASFQIPSNLLPLLGGAFVNTTGSADTNTPWLTSLGWWHTVDDRLSFGVTAAYTHWSSFKELVVNYANPAQAPFNAPTIFDYKNSWFGSFGGDYKLDDKWTLRAGVAYDQTPTTNATRDPKVPDNSRKWLTFGLGYQMNEQFRVDGGFLHLFVNDAKISNVAPTFNTLDGSFKVTGNVLAVSGQYMF